MSSGVSSSDGRFDFRSTNGVATILGFIRTHVVSKKDQRALRDLVFAYTNSGGDEQLRIEIEKRLLPLQTKSTAETATPVPPHTPADFATVRPVLNDVAVTTTPVQISVERDTARFTNGRSTPQFGIKVARELQSVAKEEIKTAITTSVSDESITSTSNDIPVRIEPKLPTIKKVPSAPSFDGTTNETTLDAMRSEIAAIKQRVNTAFGNPVHLVERDNEIGRAYMSALLDAMKAVSGGDQAPQPAMQTLRTIASRIDALTKTVGTPTVNGTLDSHNSEPSIVTPTAIPDTPVVSIEMPVATSTVKPMVIADGTDSALVQPVITASPITQTALPIVAADTAESPIAISSSRYSMPIAPVATATALRTPKDLPTEAELRSANGAVDPLYDTDVDNGLQQLLSEWSLFKKSGMFGTGPRGRQHPLFLKLADLQIPVILSGRFEGATAEIKQSITDYMNGWRYEQGIIYDKNENFEHYLRRVIHHILELQIKKRSS